MAQRGVNGASSATLNERFIKCSGCKVNIPKEDMLSLGKCTVCGRSYEATSSLEAAAYCVTFANNENAIASTQNVKTENKPKRKRWVVMVSKRGREYYHNTETGEDRWDKPGDIDAEASDNQFVPFKNDGVKKALLREQAKLEAQKLGVPLNLVAKAHSGADDDQDPLTQMTEAVAHSSSSAHAFAEPAVNSATHQEKAQAQHENDGQSSCCVM